MEGSKRSLFMMFLFQIICINLSASWKEEIYNSYINGNMENWKVIIDDMEKQKQETETFISELVNYQYGYIAWCIGIEKTASAKHYISLAENNLEWLENNRKTDASIVHAYKSAFYGFKIGMAKFKAPILGPRSVNHAQQAMEINTSNPLGFIQYGNSQYYMPSIFGGSKQVAIGYYKKAQAIMESDTRYLQNDWNYLNLLTVIAQALHETGNLTGAKKYYEKIIEIEPRFQWVKNELYPELLKKME